MLEFRQKRKIRRILYSPLSIVVLLVVAAVLVKATWNVHAKAVEARDYLSQAQDQLDKVSATQSGLAASVASLQTEQGVETDIRSQFLVAKPGEQVAVIVDGNGSDPSGDDASNTSAEATSSPSFWGRFFDFFKF